MKLRVCLTTVVILILLQGSAVMAVEEKFEGEKAEIREVIRNSIGWALNKDKELLYLSMAQDENLFFFNPDKEGTIIGFEAFRDLTENFFMKDDFKATAFEVWDMRINLSRSGEVAWFSTMLNDYGEYQGQPTKWENTRWTGVLEKRDGRWVIVQMHFSFACDEKNEKKKDDEKN